MPSQKHYAEKFNYDFRLIDDYLYKQIAVKDTISFNKILAFTQEWSMEYEYIVFIDADIFINPESPDLIEYWNDKNKVAVVDEYSQPSPIERIQVQTKMGWETSASEYYAMAGFKIKTNNMINTGVIAASPKNHAEMFKRIHFKHVLSSVGHWRAFHFEQSAIGYELQNGGVCEFLDNKFNAVWAIHKLNDASLGIESFAEENYFIHLAGVTDFDKVPELNKKFKLTQ